jgi:hypothetical protein
MSRGPTKFRQTDLARALRAALAAGLEVARIRVDKNGEITMELVTTGSTKEPATPLDEWLAAHGER